MLSGDAWKPGRVRERMPNVRPRVTATADPQSHHSRPSIWRRWAAGIFVLLLDKNSLLTTMAACSSLQQSKFADGEEFRRIKGQEKLPKSGRTDVANISEVPLLSGESGTPGTNQQGPSHPSNSIKRNQRAQRFRGSRPLDCDRVRRQASGSLGAIWI